MDTKKQVAASLRTTSIAKKERLSMADGREPELAPTSNDGPTIPTTKESHNATRYDKKERSAIADDGVEQGRFPISAERRISKKERPAGDRGLELAPVVVAQRRLPGSTETTTRGKLGPEEQQSTDTFPGAVRVPPLFRSEGGRAADRMPEIRPSERSEQLFSATLVDGDTAEQSSSLPYAEATTVPTKKLLPRNRLFFGGMLVLVAVAVVVVVAVVATRPSTSESIPQTPEFPPNAFVPTGPPSNAPSLSRISVVQTLVASFAPDGSLPAVGSPQSEAMNWLVNDDGDAEVALSDTGRLTARYALAVLYFSTNGNGWIDSLSFLTSNHECDWRSVVTSLGIDCDSNRQVVSINLPNNKLDGPIPSEIRLLAGLTRLNLMGDWQDGGVVNVRTNMIRGTIPTDIGQLRLLIQLDLSSNGLLTGVIPSEVTQLTNLVELRLNDDGLAGEAIPADIGDMPALTYLSLSNNFLTGTVPESVGNIRCFLLDGNDDLSCPSLFRRQLQAFSNRETCSQILPPCGLS